jgi:hypothetical protein
MLKLSLNAASSAWINVLPGVRVKAPPCTTAVLRAAEHAGFRAYAAAKENFGLQDGEAASDEQVSDLEGAFAQARIRSMASKIEEWEGIGGDDAQPLPITPEALDAFAAHPALGRAYLAAYEAPALSVVAEGNDFAPTGGGKRRGAKNTAGPAPADA